MKRHTPRLYVPPREPDSDQNERPTVPPPFDIEAFVRQASESDSAPDPQSEPPTHRRPKVAGPAREGPPSASSLLGTIQASVAPRSTQGPYNDRIASMRECFSFGDYAGALTIADLILSAQSDNVLALEFRTNCRAALEDVYAFRLGPLDRVPVVARLPAPIGDRSVDDRIGFLLPHVDGSSSIETILDVCGMPRLDALRILDDLVQRGIVAFK
jgi:hypothetical protein